MSSLSYSTSKSLGVSSNQPEPLYLWLQEEFRKIAHFMKYCQVLRERRLVAQTALLGRLGIAEKDILLQQSFAGMLKPSYVLVRDHSMRTVVLAIRGTHSIKVSSSQYYPQQCIICWPMQSPQHWTLNGCKVHNAISGI